MKNNIFIFAYKEGMFTMGRVQGKVAIITDSSSGQTMMVDGGSIKLR